MGASSPDPPPPLPPIKPGEAAMSFYFGDSPWAEGLGLASPEVQEAILSAERTYGPRYSESELARQEAGLFGSEDQPGLIDITSRAAPQIEGIRADTMRQQREADIQDVEALGGRATEALRGSDPQLAGLLDMQRGVVDDLFDRAGGVTPQQRRMAEQSARAAYGARGRELDNASVFAEALGREEFMRQNRQEALAGAGGLFNQYKSTSADPFQAILGRPSQSLPQTYATGQQALGLGGGPSIFNPDAGVNLALQDQANRANYNASIYGADAAYQGQRAAANASGWGSALGALGTVAGAAILACDERIKDDVRKIGSTDDGIGLYSFRYKGSPETHIGPMAQEVQKKKPDAVGHIGAGLLGVDLSKL